MVKVCHKIGEDGSFVNYTECLECEMNYCVIWRLVQALKIKPVEVKKNE